MQRGKKRTVRGSKLEVGRAKYEKGARKAAEICKKTKNRAR